MIDIFEGSAKEQEARLDYLLRQRRAVMQAASKDKRLGFDDSLRLFLKKMYYLNPQAYGTRIENWLKEKIGLESVHKNEQRGDSKNKLDVYFEIKVSYKTVDGSYNFIQIRPWHDVHGYCFVSIDPDDNYRVDYFYLTKAQAMFETFNIGHLAHGVKGKTPNEQLEHKIPLQEGSVDYSRWLRLYKVPDFKTLKKIMTKKPFSDEKRAYYGRVYYKRNKVGLKSFEK